MEDRLSQLWDAMTSVSVPLLVLGIVLQTAQTALVALAWRNILRASYPEGGVRYRTILGHYAGGNGLNAILPASAGTVAMRFRNDSVAVAVVVTGVSNQIVNVVLPLLALSLLLLTGGSSPLLLTAGLIGIGTIAALAVSLMLVLRGEPQARATG
jgi:Lysylphosphatidylglycerol synthase TM region